MTTVYKKAAKLKKGGCLMVPPWRLRSSQYPVNLQPRSSYRTAAQIEAKYHKVSARKQEELERAFQSKRAPPKPASRFVLFLQWLGLRCSKCGSWRSTSSHEWIIKWEADVGDVSSTDSIYAITDKRTCDDCRHLMSFRTQSAGPFV